MKISETIKKLEDIKKSLGDIDLKFWGMEKNQGLYAFRADNFLVEVLEEPGGERYDLRAVEDWEMNEINSSEAEIISDG